MRAWNAERVAHAAGARLLGADRDDRSGTGSATGPERAVIDSRQAGPGALFVGLRGAHADGGSYAPAALAAGAWGALVSEAHAETAGRVGTGLVLVAGDPLAALQALATEWRRDLGARVIGVTGSTGKTSTKDLLFAVLAPHRRTVASRANYNTEIGLPLEILGAPAGTEVLVLEMAMRGVGQIAELAQIAEPDVGVIVSIGPVHLELLGTVEAVAAAKAELIAALRPGATAVVPAGEPLLEAHLRTDVSTVTFGEQGDVRLCSADGPRLEIDLRGDRIELEVSFEHAHQRRNLLAAVAAAQAVGVRPGGRVELALSPGRGQRLRLTGGVTLIDDCYNANPMSMRAALKDLAATAEREGHGRRVAVLGDMLELGPREREFHAELAAHAESAGIDVLITVGPLAAETGARFRGAGAGGAGEVHKAADPDEAAALLEGLVRPGDLVLVKGSRAVGLERVCAALKNVNPPARATV